jgi:two-component system LytT family response regulator
VTRDLRVLIVDDEPLARRGIRQLVVRHSRCIVVGECRNGREALLMLDTAAPDLVFLDVQMPELDGFGVIRARGPERMPAVVFVTAYDAYAVRAFEAHAVDYLVKPVTEARFAAALARVRERLDGRRAVELARRLHALVAESGGAGAAPAAALSPDRRRVVVPTASGELVLEAGEIDWIAADDYRAEVYAKGKRHRLRESLDSLAARLESSHFVRVHRSAIVNVERVREVRSTGENAVVILADGTSVPVSRRRREVITDALRRLRRQP